MIKPILDRVDFGVVIGDDKLMGKLWKQLSVPQQTILLAAYGQPLPTKNHLAAWAMLNGNFIHDELGYPKSIQPLEYVPKVYDTIVGLIGRRSGKSFITCFAVLYEIIFGGHLNPLYVNEGEEIIIPYIAQDLPTARKNMKMIGLMANQVPNLKKYLTKFGSDTMEFFDGLLKVQIEPPMVKTGRGWAMPVVIMDEVGFWYKTADNANPDYEVQTAVTASQMQFPNRKQFIISSPYTEEGILYEYDRGGTDGRNLLDDDEDKPKFKDVLVVKAPTAAMDNPKVRGESGRKFLLRVKAQDPDGFPREYLAKFVTSISGFLPPELVIPAIDKGIKVRLISDIRKTGWNPQCVSVIDPAFRHDSFAYSIFHRTNDGTVVQDYLKVWTPDRKLGIKLDPDEILTDIAKTNKEYGVNITYSDQYQLESLQQLAMRKGFSIIGNDFTGKSKPKMYGSLKGLFRTNKIRLLDRPIIYQQLTRLIKKLTPMGGVQISAPAGAHDDVASVIALGAEISIQLYPSKQMEKVEPTLWDLCIQDIKKKNKLQEESWVEFRQY